LGVHPLLVHADCIPPAKHPNPNNMKQQQQQQQQQQQEM
jgi:hypothetical protein